jgi:hypothetical protein
MPPMVGRSFGDGMYLRLPSPGEVRSCYANAVAAGVA